MNDKINGRTPEEIKRRLGCLLSEENGDCDDHNTCFSCPYRNEIYITEEECFELALAYIQQLERERDAAVSDMRDATLCGCHVCKHYYRPDANVRIYACRKFGEFGKFDYIKDDGSMFCGAFEWRGVEVE